MKYLVKRFDQYMVAWGNRPADALATWPEEIDPADIAFCLITKDNEGNYTIVLDQALKQQAQTMAELKKNLSEAYEAMDRKVLEEAAALFGTDNQLSAFRQYLTFLRMSARPELYDNEGLRALFDVGTLKRGDSLETTVKIKEYADGMLARIDQFSIKALKDVQGFLDQKEALTGVW